MEKVNRYSVYSFTYHTDIFSSKIQLTTHNSRWGMKYLLGMQGLIRVLNLYVLYWTKYRVIIDCAIWETNSTSSQPEIVCNP